MNTNSRPIAAAFVRADRRPFRRRRDATGGAVAVDELGGDDAPRLAGDGDGEVGGRQTAHRLALLVDDADVDGDDLDAAPERRRLLRLAAAAPRRERGPPPADQNAAAVTATSENRRRCHCRMITSRSAAVRGRRYPSRARTSYLPFLTAHLDVAPAVVLLQVGRRIRQHVLIGELRDDLVEDAVELLRPLREERAPAGGLGVALELRAAGSAPSRRRRSRSV